MRLLDKISLLCKILLIKYKIIQLVWVAKPIQLNDYGKSKLDEVEWKDFKGIPGLEYKLIADPTGEYRFYVPYISQSIVWRVDQKYSITKHDKMPSGLSLIVNLTGLKDEQRYDEVWNKGKTYQ